MIASRISGAVSLGLLLILPGEAVKSANPAEKIAIDPSPTPGRVHANTNFPVSPIQIAQCRTGRTTNPRGPEDALIPYTISPRNTAVLSDRPDLRWNAVLGVNQYKVTLMNGETILWTKEVQTNRIPYPADAEPLKPGIHYSLVVEASNGHISTEEKTQPSFYLLPAPQAAIVQQAETQLAQLTSPETALLRANLYAGSELHSEASKTLETIVAQGTTSAMIYRQLGDGYARSGLSLEAEDRYLKAIPLAANDLEEQARIQDALGELYEAIENNQEAIKYLTQAKESYEQLNNQLKAKEMQERLTNLSTQA
ncbi:tetratricopeptide repeat protein [Leptolyngbya ohadii]|uniref:tetratricopeptide repeat protein n=1 Tax=Leptolyngbya ohadii TaxID=1962290 RepID=UPI000B59A5A8